MTAREVAVAVLLTLGVATELVCCVGVLAMRGAYDKLHYTAPATTVGALAIALAVVVQESLSQAGGTGSLTEIRAWHRRHPPLGAYFAAGG